MRLIRDLNHFSSLIRKLKNTTWSIETNCYLLPWEISQLIQTNHFLYEEVDNGILLFRETRDFFYLYFYISKQNLNNTNLNLSSTSLGKHIVADLVCSKNNFCESSMNVGEMLIKNGFQFYKNYIHMTRDISHSRVEDKESRRNDVKMKIAPKENFSEIRSLWEQNLDKFSIAMPYDDDLMESIERGEIYTICDNDQKILAIIQIALKGKSAIISHVVVEEKSRRKGLAKDLILQVMKYNQNINKFSLWVDNANRPAKELYLNLNFTMDNKFSNQYILYI